MKSVVQRDKGAEFVDCLTISKVFVMLTPREEQILRMRFGIGFDKALSLEELGKQFGLTADGIREIEAKILRKLRQTSRSRNLEGFQEK